MKEQFLGINIDLKKQQCQENNNLDYMIDPTFKKIWSFKNVYTTENLLDFSNHQNYYKLIYYKLIGIDLSRQANINIPQQINFTGKLEENDGATSFLLLKSNRKNILNFSLDSLIITE